MNKNNPDVVIYLEGLIDQLRNLDYFSNGIKESVFRLKTEEICFKNVLKNGLPDLTSEQLDLIEEEIIDQEILYTILKLAYSGFMNFNGVDKNGRLQMVLTEKAKNLNKNNYDTK
jgi:hypothetical protein